ncbi:universal stress protein [Lysobacter niastensis]|uniref:Universal stress protein n=1 Tax=Lysobacter niastensis TaxID=380629 RepID=A0ABS0BAV6_9GAMM|nr:universal stress protein [Lysobacter niastensis]MBF6024831.1 universal stress protein [Lysobacter niastensis]
MYKDILVPVVLGDIHEPAICAACSIAARFDARLVALAGVSIIAPSLETWKYYPASVYPTMHQSAEATTQALAEAVARRLAKEPVVTEVRKSELFWLTPAELSALHARYADLVVLGVDRKMADADARLLGGLLAGGGRPVLLVPPQTPEVAAYERIVIAWKSTPEASRAVHDALPLLQAARSVDLLTVGHGAAPLDHLEVNIAPHLQRHGVQVNLVRRSGTGPAAQEILGHAGESRADLIVAGGYSHSRALEQVIGGVTRGLLQRSPIPVLFSH